MTRLKPRHKIRYAYQSCTIRMRNIVTRMNRARFVCVTISESRNCDHVPRTSVKSYEGTHFAANGL